MRSVGAQLSPTFSLVPTVRESIIMHIFFTDLQCLTAHGCTPKIFRTPIVFTAPSPFFKYWIKSVFIFGVARCKSDLETRPRMHGGRHP